MMRVFLCVFLFPSLLFANQEIQWRDLAVDASLEEAVSEGASRALEKTLPDGVAARLIRLAFAFDGDGSPAERIQRLATLMVMEIKTKPVPLEQVTPEWMDAFVERVNGLPQGFVNPQYHLQKLAGLREALDAEVIGLDEIKTKLQRSTARALAGTHDASRPRHRILLCGPRDVAKSAIVRAHATAMGLPIKVIDMSHYAVMVNPEELYGSIIEALMSNPYTVFLFEDLEMAHPKMQEVVTEFLRLPALKISKQGKGPDDKPVRHQSFLDTTRASVFLTSTAGADYVIKAQEGGGMGFRPSPEFTRFDPTLFLEVVQADGVASELLKQTTAVLPVYPPAGSDEFSNILQHKIKRFLADLSQKHGVQYTLNAQEIQRIIAELSEEHFKRGLA